MLARTENIADREAHEKEFVGRINWSACLLSMHSLQQISNRLTGNQSDADAANFSATQLKQELVAIKELAIGNSQQLEKINQVEKQIVSLEANLQSMPQFNFSGRQSLTETTKAVRENWSTLHELRRQLLTEERFRWISSFSDMRNSRNWQKLFIALALILSAAVALFLIYLFNAEVARKISQMSENVLNYQSGKNLLLPLVGNDELCKLDQSFHAMAENLSATRKLLEESEARIKRIIEYLPIGIFVIDNKDSLEFANESARSTLALTQEILPIELNSILVKGAEWLESWRYNPETKGELTEVIAKRPNQTEFPAEVSVRSVNFADEAKLLMTLRDITERQELQKRKHAFVAMVTHDLRTPLTSIQLSLDLINLIEGINLADQSRTNLKIAQRGIDRLLHLVNELLDFEKLEAGELSIFAEAASVDEIIESSMDSVSGFAEKKGVRLEYSGENFELNCDARRITQVLVNLLSNAIKFSPLGTAIELSVKQEDQTARFSVKDEGPGIPSEKMAAIFDRYQQVSPDREIERQGTGLGLAICKAIVDKHGGRIEVESELGKGSCFTVVLPL